jgi:hypothetical protein
VELARLEQMVPQVEILLGLLLEALLLLVLLERLVDFLALEDLWDIILGQFLLILMLKALYFQLVVPEELVEMEEMEGLVVLE